MKTFFNNFTKIKAFSPLGTTVENVGNKPSADSKAGGGMSCEYFQRQLAAKWLFKGFTVIELMVVLSIMVLILTAVIVSFFSKRYERDLKIAQSKLLTDIRKVQSYSLSSRLADNKPAQFYIIKFDNSSALTAASYTIQAIVDAYSGTPKLVELEKVNFPAGVRLLSSSPFVVSSNPSPSPSSSSCMLLVFKLPFAKPLESQGCYFNNFSSDDYVKVRDFIINSGGSVNEDFNATIILQDKSGSLQKQILVNGITGVVYGQ